MCASIISMVSELFEQIPNAKKTSPSLSEFVAQVLKEKGGRSSVSRKNPLIARNLNFQETRKQDEKIKITRRKVRRHQSTCVNRSRVHEKCVNPCLPRTESVSRNLTVNVAFFEV